MEDLDVDSRIVLKWMKEIWSEGVNCFSRRRLLHGIKLNFDYVNRVNFTMQTFVIYTLLSVGLL